MNTFSIITEKSNFSLKDLLFLLYIKAINYEFVFESCPLFGHFVAWLLLCAGPHLVFPCCYSRLSAGTSRSVTSIVVGFANPQKLDKCWGKGSELRLLLAAIYTLTHRSQQFLNNSPDLFHEICHA